MGMEGSNSNWGVWLVAIIAVLGSIFAINKRKKSSTDIGTKDSDESKGMDFSKVGSVDLQKDFKESVELSDVVAYFKGIIGKLKQGEDTPFVAKCSMLFCQYPGLKIEKPESSLFLATFNKNTEEVDNVLILEYNTLGETLKNAFSKSKNGIVTLS